MEIIKEKYARAYQKGSRELGTQSGRTSLQGCTGEARVSCESARDARGDEKTDLDDK
jgi:hypothetical protein